MEALLKKKKKIDDLTESVTVTVTVTELSSCDSDECKASSCCSSSNGSSSGNSVDQLEVDNVSNGNGDESKTSNEDDRFKNLGSKINEIDMMKQRFAKLLLGEDMSGSGKGVSTALAISNAITNLSTIFGQLWRLEPIPEVKKSMWKREMEWLICVSDHIVELIPSWQNFPDGTNLEVMTCRPRSDIFINLPALRILDNMLLDILDSFTNTEFWYVDQGIIAPDAADSSASFRKTLPQHQRHRQEDEKWWLPVPHVPAGGLSDNSRKQLNQTRDCTNQILKAATAINTISLAEMEVPDSYLDTLPKNGRACLGDLIYRYITTSEQFSPDCLLDFLDLSSEHVALEIANRVEASICVWHRRSHAKEPPINANRPTAKSSWGIVKGLMVDGEKREFLAERAENLLLCLKQRFPGLTQTALDTCKINCNKDVGNSIVESYSRVLESLAYNIVARIDDLLYVDDLTKHSEKLPSVPTVSIVYPVPVSSSTHKTVAQAPRISPARGDRAPFHKEKNMNNNSSKLQRHRFGVKKVLTNYLRINSKAKICNPTDGSSIRNSNNTKSSGNQKVQITSKQSSAYKNGIRMRQNHPISCHLRLF